MKHCCICGQLFEGYGNNPAPVETRGECCDDCNINIVVPRRLLDAKKAQIRAAGFQIKSMPIWVKNNFGIGYYTRPQYEPMYLAIKGNPPPPDTAISDVLNYPRVVKQVHTCEKPIPLLQRLISTFSREGDVIFAGFGGGGVQPLLPPENCGVNIFVLNSTKITSILRHRVSKTNLRKRRFYTINGRGERR